MLIASPVISWAIERYVPLATTLWPADWFAMGASALADVCDSSLDRPLGAEGGIVCSTLVLDRTLSPLA